MNGNVYLRAILVLLVLATIVVALWLLGREPMPAKTATPDPPEPDDKLCARGTCRGPGWWIRRSLHNHRLWLRAVDRVERLERERAELRRQLQARRLQARTRADTDWVTRQIAAAEVIALESAGDPWPNCPDPHDGSGASWWDTVDCENGGSWLDSPGWYRCGLQFAPMWEARFGRLCP